MKYFNIAICFVFSFAMLSCSSSESKPEKKLGFWGKAKCKLIKKSEECN